MWPRNLVAESQVSSDVISLDLISANLSVSVCHHASYLIFLRNVLCRHFFHPRVTLPLMPLKAFEVVEWLFHRAMLTRVVWLRDGQTTDKISDGENFFGSLFLRLLFLLRRGQRFL